MLRSHILIAVRSLWRNKTFTIINIFGLVLGVATTLLIMLWVEN